MDGVLELLEGRMDVVCRRTLRRGLRASFVMCCVRRVRIQFWHDPWSSPTSLKDLYLEIFVCAVDKEARISDMVDTAPDGGGRSWNLQDSNIL